MYRGLRFTKKIQKRAEACLQDVPSNYIVESLRATVEGLTDEGRELQKAVAKLLAQIHVCWQMDMEYVAEEAKEELRQEALERGLRKGEADV